MDLGVRSRYENSKSRRQRASPLQVLKNTADLRKRAQELSDNGRFQYPVLMLAAVAMTPAPRDDLENIPCYAHLNAPVYKNLTIGGMPVLLDHKYQQDAPVNGIVDKHVVSDEGCLYVYARVDKAVAHSLAEELAPPCCSIGFVSANPVKEVAWTEISLVSPWDDPQIPYSYVVQSYKHEPLITPEQVKKLHFREFVCKATKGRVYYNSVQGSCTMGDAGKSRDGGANAPDNGDKADDAPAFSLQSYQPTTEDAHQAMGGFSRAIAETIRANPDMGRRVADGAHYMARAVASLKQDLADLRKKSLSAGDDKPDRPAALSDRRAPGYNAYTCAVLYNAGMKASDVREEDKKRVDGAMTRLLGDVSHDAGVADNVLELVKTVSDMSGRRSAAASDAGQPPAKRANTSGGGSDGGQAVHDTARGTRDGVAEYETAMKTAVRGYDVARHPSARERHSENIARARGSDAFSDAADVVKNSVGGGREQSKGRASAQFDLADVVRSVTEKGAGMMRD